ncbi:hypothetical protein [Streptomyces olivaceus]|uniref:hypothetical protein n=1 Tax=Streptomyces olivaceus TaxID=47716 RepID=UPI0022EE47EF|nr:hypothetical protein [Streptomyces olivaceus]GHI91269.1 hypothetical protein TPA0905_07400 [Streptomyces olivaceus]
MPSLPPPVWAELHHGGAWNDITGDVRVTTSPVTVTRGLSSESASEAEPTSCTCDLDSRDDRYAPRNPMSPLWGEIGRNTPFRWGYDVGGPWARIQKDGGSAYAALSVASDPGLDVTGDFDLRIDVSSDYWWLYQMLALRAVPSTNSHDWAFQIINGRLTFMWFPAGTWASRVYRQATELVKAYAGQRLALRVTLDADNGAGGHEVRFYTGRTVDDEEWNLIGDPVTGAGATSLYTGNAYMELGGGLEFRGDPNGSSLPPLQGRAYALQLRDGINGTVKVDMKTSSATLGEDTFVDATGFTWRRRGSAVLTHRHVRMSGEVPAWPPTRDLSGTDNYVSIEPSGITRRMNAGTKPQDSALRRYIQAMGPVDCWPLTDGVDSKAGKSLLGGRDTTPSGSALYVPPTWAGGTLADWVEPVLAVKAGEISGVMAHTPRRTLGDNWHIDVFMSGGGGNSTVVIEVWDVGAGTDAQNQVSIQLGLTGYLDRLSVSRLSEGSDSSSQAFFGNWDGLGIWDDRPHHLRLSVTGTGRVWTVYIDGKEFAFGGIDVTLRPPSRIRVGYGALSVSGESSTDRSLGYLTYWMGDAVSEVDMWTAYMGFQGERAGDRIERLADEAGYPVTVAGELVYQQRMGIQDQARILELLNEASRTNFGHLLDARDRAEVIHRGGSTLWNQPPALVLDYSAGVIGAPFKPVDDDKLTENDVSVKRAYGSVPARQVLEEGELSVQDPPDGVGRYDNAYTYSLATDRQADQVAGMRLHLGTYNGVRYTRLTLNLANPRVFAMIDEILRIDVGDKIRLTNLPADHGPDDVEVLVAGYTEEAGADAWTITFNCTPAEPWTTGIAGSATFGRADTGGCRLTSGVTASATSVPVTTTGARRWADSATYPGDFPFEVRTGGEVMRVTACTGTGTAQTFTVVRAVNGVSKSHPAEQDIRLAAPVYAAL